MCWEQICQMASYEMMAEDTAMVTENPEMADDESEDEEPVAVVEVHAVQAVQHAELPGDAGARLREVRVPDERELPRVAREVRCGRAADAGPAPAEPVPPESDQQSEPLNRSRKSICSCTRRLV